MNVTTVGSGADLLWVMGFGNVAESRHERWFVDRLVDAGYRVHATKLPTNGTDLERDYLRPLSEYRGDLGEHRLVAHSMGGLVVAHLDPDSPVVYLSPWWGAEEVPLLGRLLSRLPTRRRIVPITVSPADLGDLATQEDVTAPGRVSPAWMRTIRGAQDALPPIAEADVVFYTPEDAIVSVEAIRKHTTEDQRREYDGGHELFASAGREEYVERVLDELDGV